MQTVGVVGANGFLGSAIHPALNEAGGFKAIAITRENYEEMRKQEFDILINCAMPSARFRAKNEPAWDFTETVEKTANLLYGWRFKKFIQISTVSARCQLDTVYGRHKLAAEKLCDYGDNLIIRLGAIYSPSLTKGVLMDMKQGKTVFVDGNSRYCFAPLDFVATWVAKNLDRKGTIEVGGKNAIALKDVAGHLGVEIQFEGALDHQEIENPEPNFPEARDVLDFLDNWNNKK